MPNPFPEVNVLYEDNHLLALCKAAGTPTQGDATGDPSLQEAGKAYLKRAYAKPGEVFLGLVHRLDRPVSGVVLLARTSKAASRLSEQFRRRAPEKIYLAVTEGAPPREEDRLVHLLSADRRRRRVFVVEKEGAKTRRAELAYRVLGRNGSRSLLEIRLLTGAKHQIRAQLAHTGCPVVGDVKYDPRPAPAPREPLFGGRAIALHARSLTVNHPTRREPLTIEAPLPDYWPWPR